MVVFGSGLPSSLAKVSISVVRFTPKLRHTAALDIPPFSTAIMVSSFSPTIAGGLPPTRPRRRAVANPEAYDARTIAAHVEVGTPLRNDVSA